MAREGEIIRCPWHGWEFDLLTGEHLVDEKMRLRAYSVEASSEHLKSFTVEAENDAMQFTSDLRPHMKPFPFKPLALKFLLLLFTLQLMHRATAQTAPLELVPAIPYSEQQTKLPRVLLIGDSISFGYAEIVANALRDKAQIFRIKGRTAATVTGTLILDTQSGLNNIKPWLKQPWDVIHFNWGLHDVKIESKSKYVVPIEQYEANLEKLVTIFGKSNAKLIWASTTPIPEGKLSPPRLHGDEIRYNEAATRVMAKHHIPIDDLYSVAQKAIQENKVGEVQLASNVHFTPKGSQILAKSVERMVLESLPTR